MAHPVTWFQITGKDGGRLQTFYKDVFAWRIKPSPDGVVGMVTPDRPGESAVASGCRATEIRTSRCTSTSRT